MYEVQVFRKDAVIAKITVDGVNITCENYQDNILFKPFGIKEDNLTVEDLDEFYEDRCFPKDRVNCQDILDRLGVPLYEPELICRKTHGVQFDDFIWLQFSDEEQVTWNDIKLRD